MALCKRVIQQVKLEDTQVLLPVVAVSGFGLCLGHFVVESLWAQAEVRCVFSMYSHDLETHWDAV